MAAFATRTSSTDPRLSATANAKPMRLSARPGITLLRNIRSPPLQRQLARAVTENLDVVHSQFLHQRDIEVGRRCSIRRSYMLVALQLTSGMTREKHWNALVIVQIPVAHG